MSRTPGLVILVAGGAALSRALALSLAAQADGVVIVDREGGRTVRDEPPSLADAIARLKAREAIQCERADDYDDRRGDPQRDVAMLRRESGWREKQNRALLNARMKAQRRR
jgi:NAD(P)-dependent dehydrogenase (short-subunit alcohol dehydrogenase family)